MHGGEVNGSWNTSTRRIQQFNEPANRWPDRLLPQLPHGDFFEEHAGVAFILARMVLQPDIARVGAPSALGLIVLGARRKFLTLFLLSKSTLSTSAIPLIRLSKDARAKP